LAVTIFYDFLLDVEIWKKSFLDLNKADSHCFNRFKCLHASNITTLQSAVAAPTIYPRGMIVAGNFWLACLSG